MKFLIVGTGGIGGYYGAQLVKAGNEVVFVARGRHLDALQNQGLTVVHENKSFSRKVTATSLETLLESYHARDFDTIILAVKSHDTTELLARLEDWLLSSDAPIVSLQNGVTNENKIAAVLGDSRTIGGLAVRIGASVTEPGKITAKGVAQLIIGAWPDRQSNDKLDTTLLELQNVFQLAEIDIRVTNSIRYELWRKLAINNAVNPLSVLTHLDTRTLTNHDGFKDVVYRLMEETAVAASKDGVALTKSDIDEMYELIRTFDPIKTSMLVDYEKGRQLELNDICGPVIEKCQAAGHVAPFTTFVNALVKLKIKNDN